MEQIRTSGGTKAIDMHCDTISRILECRQTGKNVGLRENGLHIDLLRLREKGYLLQNFALFVFLGSGEDPWEQLQALYGVYQEEMERNKDLIKPVYCYADIEKNRREGKISSLLTVEEGAVCKGETAKLTRLYEMGVRMMTLTWNFPNEIGYPNLDREMGQKIRAAGKNVTDEQVKAYFNTPNEKNGLTETGKQFVAEMERLGMIPDVSHLSDAGFWDVYRCTKNPFVASHSNARAVCPHVRNLTDRMIRALAERGGVTGLNFCADFLVQKPVGTKNPGTIADIVAHAKHIYQVGGIEVLGLGSDFDGIDTHEELQGAQGMDLLADALVKGGFTPAQVDKIFFENVLRVYRDTL